jgi:uncharacterized protein YjeT (DUF2065 family)
LPAAAKPALAQRRTVDDPRLRRLYGGYLLAVGIVFALALSALVAAWS